MGNVSPPKDELDLLDLAFIVWKRRLALIAATVAFLGAGVLFVLTQSPVYRGELIIHPLSESEVTGFNIWNQVVTSTAHRSQPAIGMPDSALQSLTIKSADLQRKFEVIFIRNTALNAALREHSSAIQNFEGDEQELNDLVNALRSKYVLQKDEDGTVSITFETNDKSENNQILSTTLELISKAAKQDMLWTSRSILEAASLARDLELQKIDFDFQSYEQLYVAKKNRSLTLMREQARIARELNLEEPFEASSTDLGLTSVVDARSQRLGPFESRYFLQGYRAIEEQIANIEQRSESEYGSLTEETDYLVLSRAKLRKYKLEETLSPLLDQIPINDPEFRIVGADLSSLTYEKQSTDGLVVPIFTLAGLLISIFYILTRHAFQHRRAEQTLG